MAEISQTKLSTRPAFDFALLSDAISIETANSSEPLKTHEEKGPFMARSEPMSSDFMDKSPTTRVRIFSSLIFNILHHHWRHFVNKKYEKLDKKTFSNG